MKDSEIRERLTKIEVLLNNHLEHCERWLKYYLPILISLSGIFLAIYLKK